MIADDEFRPNKIDEDNLKIFDDSLVIPLRVIGCNLTAGEILKEWDALEKNGFPVIHISRLLVALEILDRQRGQLYFLPMLTHLIKIIDAIYCVRLIDGGNERANKLKKELCSLVSNATQGPIEQRKIANNQIVNTIFSYSEQVSPEQPYSICAIVSDKYKIEDYGSRLDKIEKDLKIDTKTTDGYYRLLDEARKLN